MSEVWPTSQHRSPGESDVTPVGWNTSHMVQQESYLTTRQHQYSSHDVCWGADMVEDQQPLWSIQSGGTFTGPGCTWSNRFDSSFSQRPRLVTARYTETTTGHTSPWILTLQCVSHRMQEGHHTSDPDQERQPEDGSHGLLRHQSTQDPRGSQWKTWCTIAHAWGLLPIPITDELVLAVGASLKYGGYRSSKNYFLRAQQEHRDNIDTPLSDRTLALITRVTRSINRGIGPTPLKDSFELELFHTPLPTDETDPGVWYLHTETARDITTLCCWWLLRGIEAALHMRTTTDEPHLPSLRHDQTRKESQIIVPAEQDRPIHPRTRPDTPLETDDHPDIPQSNTIIRNHSTETRTTRRTDTEILGTCL